MKILHTTTPHYIRCIKPNPDCKPLTFKKEEVCAARTALSQRYNDKLTRQHEFWWVFAVCCQVITQLEACGIVETIHISAAGFPIRSHVFPVFPLNVYSLFLFRFVILKWIISVFYRIPFKAFLQRYGLVAKYSHVEAGSQRVGKCSLMCLTWRFYVLLFRSARLLSSSIINPFISNLILSSLLFLGHLVYKNRTF